MILNVLAAVPAYRSQVSDLLGDALSELRLACMKSEAMAVHAPAHDRLVLPSARPVSFRYLGRGRADSCDLGLNRNSFVQAAIDMQAQWLLMCDADTYQLDPRPVLRMLHDGWAKDAPVIAAPVMRRDGWLNVLGFENDRPLSRAQLAGDISAVRRIGTAFMAINIPWLARHWPTPTEDGPWADPWFHFQQTIKDGRPHHLSEDFWFCDGVRRHGGTVYCDGRFEPKHDGAPEHEAEPCQPPSQSR